MEIRLPDDFITKMEALLGEEAAPFLSSYSQARSYGLRINPLKPLSQELSFAKDPVPWAKEGFYADPGEHPGRHPLHEAGAYYIQEPSAMAVVSLLDPQPGERICDLCAAPGGKSTQIAGRMERQGLLVSNELLPSRAKILSQNMERLGVANGLVCSEPPDRMAAHFPLFFDRILIDAPCSGEGMFRKDDTAIAQWSREQNQICAQRQKMILSYGDEMLKPGGILVYSTCTFSPEENEQVIDWFLSSHPDYILEDWRNTALGLAVGPQSVYEGWAGLDCGRPDWLEHSSENSSSLKGVLRLWPHKLRGEGHFAARLRKGAPSPSPCAGPCSEPRHTGKKGKNKKAAGKKDKALELSGYRSFRDAFLAPGEAIPFLPSAQEDENLVFFGDSLSLLPPHCPPIKGLRVLRAGLQLGTNRKNRFEPAHGLAMALRPEQARYQADCTLEQAMHYLRGETISCPSHLKGWCLVCFQGLPLGWGKAQNGIVKNHYPKGLRLM